MFTFKINEFQNAYGRWSSAQSGFSTLPPVARLILMVLALPGIALACLSLVLFIVSILALLLLTVPAYRVLSAVMGGRAPAGPAESGESLFDPEPSPGRKQVEVRVVE
jgi:hypothetical protein